MSFAIRYSLTVAEEESTDVAAAGRLAEAAATEAGPLAGLGGLTALP